MRIMRRLMVASTLAVVVTAGCTDLSLPPKSSVTAANIFNDPNSYRAYLAKMYAGLSVTGQSGQAGNPDITGIDEGFSQYIRLYWQMQELPTDEAVIAWNDAGVQELNTQLWGDQNQFLNAMYYRIAFQVSLANEFLRQTTASKLSSRGVTPTLAAQIQTYRAEARFLRALSYWHGLDLFANIPLVTESYGLGGAPPPQATPQEVFSFIESELLAIRDSLPAAGQQEYGRADQGAVDMLLANLYLNANVYTGTDHSADALLAAKRVIDSDAYSLDPNYFNNFKADNNTSPEMIFTVPQDGIRTQSYGGMTFIIHAQVGGDMQTSDYGIDFGWWGLRMRPEAVSIIGSDPRGGFFTQNQTDTVYNLTEYRNGRAITKFSNVTSGGQPGSNPGFPDTDYPMFRLGEAYLIYAEAELRGGGGDAGTALTYINDLRERAYGDASGDITSNQLTLPFIEDEWTREMYWEGYRRQVLRRFGDFTGGNYIWQWKGGTFAGTATDSFRDLYPLPGNELIANPNLKQNPGY